MTTTATLPEFVAQSRITRAQIKKTLPLWIFAAAPVVTDDTHWIDDETGEPIPYTAKELRSIAKLASTPPCPTYDEEF